MSRNFDDEFNKWSLSKKIAFGIACLLIIGATIAGLLAQDPLVGEKVIVAFDGSAYWENEFGYVRVDPASCTSPSCTWQVDLHSKLSGTRDVECAFVVPQDAFNINSVQAYVDYQALFPSKSKILYWNNATSEWLYTSIAVYNGSFHYNTSKHWINAASLFEKKSCLSTKTCYSIQANSWAFNQTKTIKFSADVKPDVIEKLKLSPWYSKVIIQRQAIKFDFACKLASDTWANAYSTGNIFIVDPLSSWNTSSGSWNGDYSNTELSSGNIQLTSTTSLLRVSNYTGGGTADWSRPSITRYYAVNFSSATTGNLSSVDVFVMKEAGGTAYDASIEIWGDSGTAPNSANVLGGCVMPSNNFTTSWLWQRCTQFNKTITIIAGTTYYVVMAVHAGIDGNDDNWRIDLDGHPNFKRFSSSDYGATWAISNYQSYFNITLSHLSYSKIGNFTSVGYCPALGTAYNFSQIYFGYNNNSQSLAVQGRFSNDNATWGAWSANYSNGQTALNNSAQCVQWKATENSDSAGTPYLSSVNVTYSASNIAPSINSIIVYNGTQYQDNYIYFKVNVSDADGANNILNVTLTIGSTLLNASFNNTGNGLWNYSWLVPSDFAIGVYPVKINATDATSARSYNITNNPTMSATPINISNSYKQVNASSAWQEDYSLQVQPNTSAVFKFFKQIGIINKGLSARNFNVSALISTAATTFSVFNSTNGTITATNNAGLVNFTLAGVTGTKIMRVEYNVTAVISSVVGGICDNALNEESGSCEFRVNYSNLHNSVLDNVRIYVPNSDLPHISEVLGNIEIYWNIINGSGGGSYERGSLNLTSMVDVGQDTTIDFIYGGGIGGFSESDADISNPNYDSITGNYTSGSINNSNNYLSDYTLGSVSTTQDLGASSTYQLRIVYTWSKSVIGANLAGAAGGGGGVPDIISNFTAKFGFKQIDKYVLVYNQPTTTSHTIQANKEIRACASKALDLPCEYASAEAIISVPIDIGNSFSSIIKDEVQLTFFDGEVSRYPITLRIINLGVYAPLKEGQAKAWMEGSAWLFYVQGGLLKGIRIMPFAAAAILFFGIVWIAGKNKQRHARKSAQYNQFAKMFKRH